MSSSKIVGHTYDLMADTYDSIESEAFYINQYGIYESHIKNHINSFRGTILDIGCGTGIQIKMLERYSERIIGVDISLKLLKKAKEKFKDKSNIELILADACYLPFRDGSYDCAYSYGEPLSHIKNFDKAFFESSRVLKKGGTFIFSVLNKWNIKTVFSITELKEAIKIKNGHSRLWSVHSDNDGLVSLTLKTFSPIEINFILKNHKFELLDITGIHIISLLIPLSYQYGKINIWGKIFMCLGKIDKLLNKKNPFCNFGYSKIITAKKDYA